MWPAVVLDESLARNCKGLKMILGGRSVPVQFFGTHDFARFDILWKLKKNDVFNVLVGDFYLYTVLFFPPFKMCISVVYSSCFLGLECNRWNHFSVDFLPIYTQNARNIVLLKV